MSSLRKVSLPYPPSGNRYWRKTRTGRVYVSKEASDYKEAVSEALSESTPHPGPISVHYTFYRPKRQGDLDNRIKVLQDALNGLLWVDDSQLEEIHAYRLEDKERPRVELLIEGR